MLCHTTVPQAWLYERISDILCEMLTHIIVRGFFHILVRTSHMLLICLPGTDRLSKVSFGGNAVSVCCRWMRMQPPYVPQPIISVIRKLFGFVPLLVYGAHFSAVPFKVNAMLMNRGCATLGIHREQLQYCLLVH